MNRLFHSIVLVGASMTAACGARVLEAPGAAPDGGGDTDLADGDLADAALGDDTLTDATFDGGVVLDLGPLVDALGDGVDGDADAGRCPCGGVPPDHCFACIR